MPKAYHVFYERNACHSPRVGSLLSCDWVSAASITHISEGYWEISQRRRDVLRRRCLAYGVSLKMIIFVSRPFYT